jgi:hypothetical protein
LPILARQLHDSCMSNLIYLIIQGVFNVPELLPWPIRKDDLDSPYIRLFSKFPLKLISGGMVFTLPVLLIVTVDLFVVDFNGAAVV